jgi:hypothetical protein
MSSARRDDLRALLKNFGIQSDEAVIAHLARNPRQESLRLRLTLQDLTDYGTEPPTLPLELTVEGEV